MNRTFPQLFQDRIKEILPAEELEAYFESATSPLPRSVRWSTLHSDYLVPKGWDLTWIPEIPDTGFLSRENQKEEALGHTHEHFSGKLYAASLSSLLAVQVLDPQPGEHVLDMCAAPGSKTTFIANKMKNTGFLLANEMDGKRLQKLTHNLNRLGVLNTAVIQYDGAQLPRFLAEPFDKILLDAPCSSEGYGRKKADFFETTWDVSHIYEMAKIQKRLIKSAFQMLKVGGEMVFSTCTSAPEENEMVVQHLVDTFGDKVEILDIDLGTIPHKLGLKHWDNRDIDQNLYTKVKRLYPHLSTKTWDSESFFISKVRKLGSTPHEREKGYLKNPPLLLKKHQLNKIFDQLKTAWDIDLDKETYDVLKYPDGSLTLTTPDTAEFVTRFPNRSVGMHFMDKDNNISTEFAIHFGPQSKQNCIEISEEDSVSWLKGQNLPLAEETDLKLVFICHKGLCLGWGKVINGTKVKNKVPRGLIW